MIDETWANEGTKSSAYIGNISSACILEKHGCHPMILRWSYHDKYESPLSYHVIAWSSCLTMAVNLCNDHLGIQNTWLGSLAIAMENYRRHFCSVDLMGTNDTRL